MIWRKLKLGLTKKVELFSGTTKTCGRKLGTRAHSNAATRNLKNVGNLFGKKSFASHPGVPLGVVQPAVPAQMAKATENLILAIGKMLAEPMLEKRRDRPWQTTRFWRRSRASVARSA